jgi:hypothetical protein
VLLRRLRVYVLVLVVGQLFILWSWLVYSALVTNTSASSLPYQTSVEQRQSADEDAIPDWGDAVYPREIDDPNVEKAVSALKDEPHSTAENLEFAFLENSYSRKESHFIAGRRVQQGSQAAGTYWSRHVSQYRRLGMEEGGCHGGTFG